MISILLSVALAAAKPAPQPVAQRPVQPLGEAAYAIQAGRLEQARLMIADAVKAGASGPEVERLIADLSFANGDYKAALARYLQLLVASPNDAVMYEKAGIAAVKIGDMAQAERLLERATSFPTANWRAWNARGVAADYRSDWATADQSYSRAAELASDRAEILNNFGWSLLIRGQWADALDKIQRAAAIDPKSERIADNLELARAAMTEELPQRRPNESEADWTARLNDAGVIARLQGNSRKAVAAFTQAIEARSQYYTRAANNLAMASPAK